MNDELMENALKELEERIALLEEVLNSVYEKLGCSYEKENNMIKED